MNTVLRLACIALLFAGVLAATPTQAADLRAVLITASAQPGPTDSRLASYETTLKRVLRFNSYTFQGSDSAALPAKGSASLVIGQGHELAVETSENPLSLRVRWTAGGRTLMNTGLNLRPGVAAVLGGPATGEKPGEVYAVILVAR